LYVGSCSTRPPQRPPPDRPHFGTSGLQVPKEPMAPNLAANGGPKAVEQAEPPESPAPAESPESAEPEASGGTVGQSLR
jgi:hypothetical protein